MTYGPQKQCSKEFIFSPISSHLEEVKKHTFSCNSFLLYWLVIYSHSCKEIRNRREKQKHFPQKQQQFMLAIHKFFNLICLQLHSIFRHMSHFLKNFLVKLSQNLCHDWFLGLKVFLKKNIILVLQKSLTSARIKLLSSFQNTPKGSDKI